MGNLNVTPEQVDKWSQACDRMLTAAETVEQMDLRMKSLEDKFGKLPIRNVPLPGAGFTTMESRKDNKEVSQEFLHWIRCVGTRKTFDDTPDTVKRALTEGTDSQGGYLVPEVFVPELLRVIELTGVMRPLVRTMPMATDTSNIPSLSSGMTVYWPAENQEITQADPVFGTVQLLAKTMAALTSASMELEEDSQLALAALLVELFGEAIADEEDKQMLNSNAAPFTGVLYNSSVTQVTMGSGDTAFTDLDFQDIADLMSNITTRAQQNARFFLHRTITTILRKVRDANHQYIWSPPTGNDPATIWGFPYSESDQMPHTTGTSTNFLCFGNPKYIILGDRRRITVARSGEVGFKSNETYWKVTERIAVQAPAIPTAFARLRTAAS
jgi:HK97 family phage major capsid protein